jgi:hypothetical protein
MGKNWRRARLADLDAMGGDILVPGMRERVRDLWTDAEMHLLGRTLEIQGEPVAVVGISLHWEGVAYAWAFVNRERIQKHPLAFLRGTRNLLLWAMDAFQLRRVQATCLTEPPAFHRTLESLGFVREGLMRGYGMDGTDHYLYAFLRP